MTDRIEKRIELNAPSSRVWKAITDYREFGKWFQIELEGPFIIGKSTRGKILIPEYANYPWEVVVQKMEPETRFSFTWHPYAIDSKRDYSQEASTLVEFRLEKIENGTLLILTESGFENIPTDRRLEAFNMHEMGWAMQMENIKSYVEFSE